MNDMRAEAELPRLFETRTAFTIQFDKGCRAFFVAFIAAAVALPAFAQANLSRMLNLLDVTPEGGWVQVNTNRYSDAWVTGPDAIGPGSYSDPAAIIHAWSSFAWDSNRGNLLLWGGGHANYMGNEMYVWQGSTGLWTRGSVSSRLERYNTSSTYFTVDNAAPQSAHTYDNNLFLPLSDLFITFGGAAFNSGGVFVNKGPSGTPVRAGPWLWDPRKADPNMVGGTTGSGYNSTTPGGQMWINQQGKWVGAEPPSYTEATSAYVEENGRDVVYVTGDSNASGWPSLYRYDPDDARAGATGRFEKVAVAWNAPGYQSTGAIDPVNRVYVRISKVSNFPPGLGVWDLTKISASNPTSVTDRLVRLVLPDGSFFDPNVDYGMEFDSARGKFVLWDGHQGGTVYETQSVLDGSRNIAATWPITAVPSSTAAWPTGNYQTGVLGKWRFVKELGAFVALDEFQLATADAAVWLYKPVGWRRPGSGGGGNAPPSATLTSPASGASAAAPGSFVLSANASDADGTVSRVDFYAGSTLIGSDSSAPYSVTWGNVSAGSYTLTAVAVDNLGASTTSSAVQVAVNAITIASSANPVVAGTNVTFTASVTGNAPTGGVTFADAGTTIAGCNAVPLTGAGSVRTATCATSTLAVGIHSITAGYSGDTNNQFVTSAPLSQSVTATGGSDTNWLDDAVPAGAVVTTNSGNPWNTAWDWTSSNPTPNSGALTHRSSGTSGTRQHYFYNAATTLAVGTADTLFAYVYIDAASPPKQLLLQWNDGTWEHRAYWGTNVIGWGTDGTTSLRYMGPIPAAGQWVRLQVPAAQVGLAGRTLSGMAFAHYDGVVTWDSAGKTGGGNVPPSVALTSPANGANAAAPGSFVVSANAIDSDGTVSRVDFFAGSTPIGSDSTPPYSVAWSNVVAGSYTITAVAVDNLGASATSSPVNVTVTAPNAPPVVSLSSPASGANAAAPGSFVLSANASDADGTVSRVDFYAGSTLIGSDSSAPYSVTWGNVSAGSYTLTAVAVDNLGASTTSSAVQVAVNAITIASSANPVVAGTNVTFTASVTGNAPTGGVTFADAGTTIAGCNAVPLTGAGSVRTATCATSSLAVGTHSIAARYGGDANNGVVTSAPLSQSVTFVGGTDIVWLDDAVPVGSVVTTNFGNPWNTAWNWVGSNPTPNSGALAHTSPGTTGTRQHYFYNAATTLAVGTADTLFAYVYIDAASPPKQLLLQWNDGTWEHRAYWGTNVIGWGTDGTTSLRYMGPIPAAGQWVRLQVPAAQVGLAGRTLNGMAFAHYDGVVMWDSAGKSP